MVGRCDADELLSTCFNQFIYKVMQVFRMGSSANEIFTTKLQQLLYQQLCYSDRLQSPSSHQNYKGGHATDCKILDHFIFI